MGLKGLGVIRLIVATGLQGCTGFLGVYAGLGVV